MGKILECAAIAATPGAGADCAFGTLREDSFILESLNPVRRFTKRVGGRPHPLREVRSLPSARPRRRARPDRLLVHRASAAAGSRSAAAGTIDSARYWSSSRASAGSASAPIAVAGTRDPIMIRNIDGILEGVEARSADILKAEASGGRIHFHVYGKDGVMGALEPERRIRSHELGIVIEAVAPTQEEADALCSLTRSTLLHYGYPGRISTAGNLALPFSPSDARMGEVYEFSVYHLMPVAGPTDFPARGRSRSGAERSRHETQHPQRRQGHPVQELRPLRADARHPVQGPGAISSSSGAATSSPSGGSPRSTGGRSPTSSRSSTSSRATPSRSPCGGPSPRATPARPTSTAPSSTPRSCA